VPSEPLLFSGSLLCPLPQPETVLQGAHAWRIKQSGASHDPTGLGNSKPISLAYGPLPSLGPDAKGRRTPTKLTGRL
jgi:hypothetical protein